MDAEGEPAVEPEPEPELDADVEPLEETGETNELEEGSYDDRARKDADEEAMRRAEEDRQQKDRQQEGRQIPADLVEELTRRVAARLVREAKK